MKAIVLHEETIVKQRKEIADSQSENKELISAKKGIELTLNTELESKKELQEKVAK